MNPGRIRAALPLLLGAVLLVAFLAVRLRVRPEPPPIPAPRTGPAPSPPPVAGSPDSKPATGTGVVRGKVLHARTREPLAGALVSLKGFGKGVSVKADAQGRFESPSLPLETVSLTATIHECDWRSVPQTVVVGAEPSAEVILEVSGLRILSGRVLTWDGKTPASSVVRAHFGTEGPPLTQTPVKGEFRFLVDPSHASLKLSAEAEGYAPSEPLAVSPGDRDLIEGLELRLTRGGGVAGVVIDEAGLPLLKARVTLEREGPEEKPKIILFSDPAGRFSSPPLAAGSYTISATRTGLLPAQVEGWVVADGASSSALTLRLRKGWTIRGRLIDASTRPIPNGLVRVREGTQVLRAATDADGRFEVAGIEPDTGEANRFSNIDQVQGSAPGFGPVALEDVPPGSDLSITLLKAGRLLLKVRGAEGPLPPQHTWTVRLSLRQPENPQGRRSDPGFNAVQGQGAGATIENLAPGTYEGDVSAPGRTTVRLEGLRIVSGTDVARDVILLPGKSDVPLLDFQMSGPEDLKTRLPALLSGYTDEAVNQLIPVLKGLYPPGTAEGAALEEVLLKLRSPK